MELFSVLITGANRGIGLEFTSQLVNSSQPAKHVFATYRNKDSTQKLSEIQKSAPPGVQVHLVKLDVRESSDLDNLRTIVEDAVGERGLTLLINNAGIANVQSFPDVSCENLKIHFEVNTIGPILVAQKFLPLLKKAASLQPDSGMRSSKAAILNMSTAIGSMAYTGVMFTVDLAFPSYKISKAALNMAMRTMAHTVKDDGILIVNMCPGYVKTDMTGDHAKITTEESISAMLGTISKLNESQHGTFVDRFGNPIPW